MFEKILRPELTPQGYASHIQLNPGPEAPAPKLQDAGMSMGKPKEHEVIVDPAIYNPHSWLRKVAESVREWSADLPVSLTPNARWHREPTRLEYANSPGLKYVTGEHYKLEYALRVFPEQDPGIFANKNKRYIDLELQTTGGKDGVLQLENNLHVYVRSAKGEILDPQPMLLRPLTTFAPLFLKSNELKLPEGTSEHEVRQHCKLLTLLLPALYTEGLARGYTVGSSKRPQPQRVSNDLQISSDLQFLSHPLNRELPTLERALRDALSVTKFKTERNILVDGETKLHWNLVDANTSWRPKSHAHIVGSFVSGSYPMRVAVLNGSGEEPLFFRHFNHPRLLEAFVIGLAQGTHIGAALRSGWKN